MNLLNVISFFYSTKLILDPHVLKWNLKKKVSSKVGKLRSHSSRKQMLLNLSLFHSLNKSSFQNNTRLWWLRERLDTHLSFKYEVMMRWVNWITVFKLRRRLDSCSRNLTGNRFDRNGTHFKINWVSGVRVSIVFRAWTGSNSKFIVWVVLYCNCVKEG